MRLARIIELAMHRRCAYVCPGRPFLGPPADCRKPPGHDGACVFSQDSDERSETPITTA